MAGGTIRTVSRIKWARFRTQLRRESGTCKCMQMHANVCKCLQIANIHANVCKRMQMHANCMQMYANVCKHMQTHANCMQIVCKLYANVCKCPQLHANCMQTYANVCKCMQMLCKLYTNCMQVWKFACGAVKSCMRCKFPKNFACGAGGVIICLSLMAAVRQLRRGPVAEARPNMRPEGIKKLESLVPEDCKQFAYI